MFVENVPPLVRERIGGNRPSSLRKKAVADLWYGITGFERPFSIHAMGLPLPPWIPARFEPQYLTDAATTRPDEITSH
jgi:hypothetical protein